MAAVDVLLIILLWKWRGIVVYKIKYIFFDLIRYLNLYNTKYV